jgi:hypothetical protein
MSIFVEESDVIEIPVHYAAENGNVVVLDEPTEKTTTLKTQFRRPDFAISQRLVATSTVTDANGSQTLNLMVLQNNLIYFLAKSWDAKEPDTKDAEGKVVPGKPIELNAENIGKLRVEIARAIVNKLVSSVGQIM